MKKSFILTMILGIMSIMALPACAAQAGGSSTTEAYSVESNSNMSAEPLATGMEEAEETWVSIQWIDEFPSFSGTVVAIQPYMDGQFFVIVENEDEDAISDTISNVNFLVDRDSVLLIEGGIAVGMEVAGFYDTFSDMTINESQGLLNARALVLGHRGVIVDRFSKSDIYQLLPGAQGGFIGSTEVLFIHIGTDTEILFQDGSPFEGELIELENRAFAVVSDYWLWSDPAQTMPNKIVVLFERAVHPTLQLSPEELEAFWNSMFDPETVQIIVDGEAIEAPTPYVNRETGFPMIPVVYIAQALGYPVYIDDQDPEMLTIGRGITLTVGIDNYNYMRMAPIQLGAGPEMHDGVVFVPMHFFGEVMPVAAYIMDGNIMIRSDQIIGGDVEMID